MRRQKVLRLGEGRRPRREQLEHVDAVVNLAGPRDAERIGLPIEVQAGHLGEPHPRVETLGVGRSGEQLDVVTKLDETAAEVADVDALPTTMRLASVRQQGNPHGQFTAARVGIRALDMCPDYSLTS